MINNSQVNTYWDIGRAIIQDEQKGNKRAEYGKAVLTELASKLTDEFGKAFDERELRRMRQFYTIFQIRDALRPELSWTHYRLILKVENEKAREYYLKEAAEQGWYTRALERQINSFYYERLLASEDKEPVRTEAMENTAKMKEKPEDFIRNPVILEFLGLPGNAGYKEKDIEQALITHLQRFLLELGKGFAFVARQQHIKTETSDFFIDLVFYNFQ